MQWISIISKHIVRYSQLVTVWPLYFFFYYSVFTSVIITFCIFLCFVKQIKPVCKVYSFSTLQQKNKQRHLHNSICGNLFLVFLLLANSNPPPEQSVCASYAMLGHHKSFRTHLLPWWVSSSAICWRNNKSVKVLDGAELWQGICTRWCPISSPGTEKPSGSFLLQSFTKHVKIVLVSRAEQ